MVSDRAFALWLLAGYIGLIVAIANVVQWIR